MFSLFDVLIFPPFIHISLNRPPIQVGPAGYRFIGSVTLVEQKTISGQQLLGLAGHGFPARRDRFFGDGLRAAGAA